MTIRSFATIAVLLAVGSQPARADDDTIAYTVKPGDTCAAIATRELGDRKHIEEIHALNPQLGPSPHNLKPGSTLTLPHKSSAPDAKLTAARGAVNVRKPTVESWDAAERGMSLFSAWRVGSKDRSTAEVTFRDASRLFMRENTIVIIYGATIERATMSSVAELETGALESRLSAASKRHVVVRTPSAEAGLGEGHALVTVDANKATVVANHGGRAAAVRGLDKKQHPQGPAVQVAAGMGSKVKQGEPPSKPRPLPPAPAWQTTAARFVELAGSPATVGARWAEVPAAARYRVVIRTADGADVAAVTVDAPALAFEVHNLPVGNYIGTTAVIDAEGFESAPSVELPFEIVAIAAVAPGDADPIAAAPPPATPPDPTTATPPPTFAVGTRIVSTDAITCTADGAGTIGGTVGAGTTAIACLDRDGHPFAPVAVRVARVAMCLGSCEAPAPVAPLSRTAPTTLHFALQTSAHLGAALSVHTSTDLAVRSSTRTPAGIDVVVEPTPTAGTHASISITTATGTELVGTELAIVGPSVTATDVPRAKPRLLELGAFGAYWLVGHGSGLGNSSGQHGISSGPAGGLRVAAWPVEFLGGEIEGVFAWTGLYNDPASGKIAGARGRIVARYESGLYGIRILAGAGFDSLLSTSATTARDTDLMLEAGIAGTLKLDKRWLLRLDLRGVLMTDPNSSLLVPELQLGVAYVP